MNKKNLLGTLAIGGLVISAPLAAFAVSDNGTDSLENINKKNFNSPMDDLSDEQRLEFMKEETQLKIDHTNTIINLLEEEGVDVSGFDSIVEDYAELNEFLNSVEVDDMTKEELREAFFDLRPDREGMRELRDALRENFDEDKLSEIREEFHSDMEDLREKYGLPEREMRGPGGGSCKGDGERMNGQRGERGGMRMGLE